MLIDVCFDQRRVISRPCDRGLQAGLEIDFRLEFQSFLIHAEPNKTSAPLPLPTCPRQCNML